MRLYQHFGAEKKPKSNRAQTYATKEIKRLAKAKGYSTVIIAIPASVFDQDAEFFLSLITEIRDQHTVLADMIQQKIDQFEYDEILKML